MKTGLFKGQTVFVHLGARRWRQINSILANHAPGTTQAYVWIEQFIGNNPFLAYAVVNDGGAPGRTQRRRRLPARPEIAPPEALGPLILRLQQNPRPFSPSSESPDSLSCFPSGQSSSPSSQSPRLTGLPVTV